MCTKNIITFSKEAIRRLQLFNNGSFFLSLKSGGCSGFEYSITPMKSENFENMEKIKVENVDIYVCRKSLLFLIGTHVEWSSDVMESKFVFTNPNAAATCGCGVSFTPKFEKEEE